MISTAVEKVTLIFGKPDEQWLDKMTVAECTHFAKGSMEPRIQDCIGFIENGGKATLITHPEIIGRALVGESGSWFVS